MADQELSALPSITGANTAAGDLFEIVDISDTSSVPESGAGGTNKKITRDELKLAVVPSAAPNALTGSPTLIGWWDADVLSGSEGSAVSTWDDSGSNNYDLVQASGSLQPLLRLSNPAFNGRKSVDFDGTDDLMAVTTGAGSSSAVSAFVVAQSDTAGNMTFLDARGTNFLNLGMTSTAFQLRAGAPSSITTVGGSIKGLCILIGVFDGTNAWLYVDGLFAAWGTASGALTPGTITVGARGGTPTQYFNGQIAEVGLYGAALTATQVQQLHNGLAKKYRAPGLVMT